jgi:hypothetical protein
MNLKVNDIDSIICSVRVCMNRCVLEIKYAGELLAKNAGENDIAGVHGSIVAINSLQAEYFNWERILYKLERERDSLSDNNTSDWQPCECSGCREPNQDDFNQAMSDNPIPW